MKSHIGLSKESCCFFLHMHLISLLPEIDFPSVSSLSKPPVFTYEQFLVDIKLKFHLCQCFNCINAVYEMIRTLCLIKQQAASYQPAFTQLLHLCHSVQLFGMLVFVVSGQWCALPDSFWGNGGEKQVQEAYCEDEQQHSLYSIAEAASQAQEQILLGACGWNSCAIQIGIAQCFLLAHYKCLVNFDLQVENQVVIHMSVYQPIIVVPFFMLLLV